MNCYAEKIAKRFSGPGKPYEGLIHRTGAWNGMIRMVPEKLPEPIRWREPRRIFVNSMSDLFHPAVPFEYIDRVFLVMACTTRHTYQILTKRPERMLEYFARFKDREHFPGCVPDAIADAEWPGEWLPLRGNRGGYDNCGPLWPLENVWLGVSVENQETADQRIPLLLQTPAAVRFLSCEPLLGPITLRRPDFSDGGHGRGWIGVDDGSAAHGPTIGWIIVGGESGPGARPCSIDAVRGIVDQCSSAGCPVFVKQLGKRLYERRLAEGRTPGVEHALANLGSAHPQRAWFHNWTLVHVDGESWWYRYSRLKDSKGGDPNEWPEELKVRQWPQATTTRSRSADS